MQLSVMNFNQEDVVKAGLDLTDLVILDYIIRANGNPFMQHITNNEVSYVWISHEHFLQDLPILNMSEGTFRNRLSNLRKKGLIMSITDKLVKGSKTFYSVTELTMSFQNDIRRNFKMTSDNIRDDIDIIKTDNNTATNNTNKNKEEVLIEDANYNKDKKNAEKIKWFVENYNNICKSLPKCTRLTDKRRKAILKIMNNFSEEEILQVFTNIEASDFCKGSNDRGWKANFDFILREDKFVSALEGRYNNKKRGCNVETISRGTHKGISKEEKEELRRLVESGELEEY